MFEQEVKTLFVTIFCCNAFIIQQKMYTENIYFKIKSTLHDYGVKIPFFKKAINAILNDIIIYERLNSVSVF